MITKCANPECDTEFLHSEEGQLFAYEIRNPHQPCKDVPAAICKKKPKRAVVYFWLCERCCHRLTLHFTVSSGVTLVLKHSEAEQDAVRDQEDFERRYA